MLNLISQLPALCFLLFSCALLLLSSLSCNRIFSFSRVKWIYAWFTVSLNQNIFITKPSKSIFLRLISKLLFYAPLIEFSFVAACLLLRIVLGNLSAVSHAVRGNSACDAHSLTLPGNKHPRIIWLAFQHCQANKQSKKKRYKKACKKRQKHKQKHIKGAMQCNCRVGELKLPSNSPPTNDSIYFPFPWPASKRCGCNRGSYSHSRGQRNPSEYQ